MIGPLRVNAHLVRRLTLVSDRRHPLTPATATHYSSVLLTNRKAEYQLRASADFNFLPELINNRSDDPVNHSVALTVFSFYPERTEGPHAGLRGE